MRSLAHAGRIDETPPNSNPTHSTRTLTYHISHYLISFLFPSHSTDEITPEDRRIETRPSCGDQRPTLLGGGMLILLMRTRYLFDFLSIFHA